MLYCPKCATQNTDNARFCRACGSDISLVPAALTGRMPQAPVIVDEDESRHMRRRHRRKERKAPTYEKAFENIGVGIAFMVISIAVALFMPSGKYWWFWLLIPTFACLGEGIGQFMRLRRELPNAPASATSAELPPSTSRAIAGDYPVRGTSEIMSPPPSVTEGTTRHLGAEAPNKSAATPD